MATGDQNDIVNRLLATLPPWFPNLSNAPVLNAILQATGDSFSSVYGYLQFVQQQERIKTATGGWLDLAAWDYFGGNFVRRQGESDTSFQARILKELLRPRQTRAAIIQMLTDLTGQAPIVREPWSTFDYGSYDTGQMGYDVGLAYGDLQYPYQIFIDAYTPGQGIPLISGFDDTYGGYDTGSLAYVDLSQVAGAVTNAEIYQRITQTVAAGVTAWTNITVAGSNTFIAGQLNGQVPQLSGLLGFF